MDHTNELQKSVKQAQTIAFAMISSVVLFIVIAAMMGVHPDDAKAVSGVETFRIVAWIAGISSLVMSFVLKNTTVKSKTVTDVKSGIKALNSMFLMAFATCEAPVLFGCVVYYLSNDPQDLLMPLLVGGIGFSMHFPRYDQWENWIKNHQN